MYASGQDTVAAIAKTLGVSRASIDRHLTAPPEVLFFIAAEGDSGSAWPF
jgi:hypothetical protein